MSWSGHDIYEMWATIPVRYLKTIELQGSQIMSQATVELPAIAFEKDQQQTQLFSLDDRTPDTKGKLISQWLRDEQAKLYCQWVMA